jgi:hypothetical protein
MTELPIRPQDESAIEIQNRDIVQLTLFNIHKCSNPFSFIAQSKKLSFIAGLLMLRALKLEIYRGSNQCALNFSARIQPMFSVGVIKGGTLCSFKQLPIILPICEHCADDCLKLNGAYSSKVLHYKCLECCQRQLSLAFGQKNQMVAAARID